MQQTTTIILSGIDMSHGRRDVNFGKFGYKADINHHCIEDYHDGKSYGNWRKIYQNSFRGIVKVSEYPDLTSIHDLQEGDQCFVVWAEWNSGDSFGNALGGGAEAIAIFKNIADATECAKAIRKHHDDKRGEDASYEFFFRASDGQEVCYGFAPWSGYFEYLTHVHVEHAIVNGKMVF